MSYYLGKTVETSFEEILEVSAMVPSEAMAMVENADLKGRIRFIFPGCSTGYLTYNKKGRVEFPAVFLLLPREEVVS